MGGRQGIGCGKRNEARVDRTREQIAADKLTDLIVLCFRGQQAAPVDTSSRRQLDQCLNGLRFSIRLQNSILSALRLKVSVVQKHWKIEDSR